MTTLNQIQELQSALQDGIEKVGDNWVELTLSTEDYDVLLDLLEAANDRERVRHGLPKKKPGMHYYPEESKALIHEWEY